MNSRDVSLLAVVLIVLSTFSFTLVTLPENARAKTLYVGGSGPGNYSRIQPAIDAANIGDTVYVYSGFYLGGITINKTLNFTGEDRDMTFLSDGGLGDVISVSADWVNISGFTVTNGSAEWDRAGITLSQVQNSRIFNCDVSSNRHHGIFLYDSNDNTISDNTISSNDMGGIYLLYSNNSTITGNTLSKNFLGITLVNTVGNTVTDNTMMDDGVYVYGDAVEYWNTHTIEISNTVSGKPVHYWKDTVGGIVPAGAGQVILANCSSVTIENQNVSNGDVGISLGFSSSNTIANNTASDGAIGILLWYSDDNRVINNIASRNSPQGIFNSYSNNNTFVSNFVSENFGNGIAVHDSTYITVFDNTLISNLVSGIYVEDSTNVNVIKNTGLGSGEAAIYLSESDDNTIVNNTLSLTIPPQFHIGIHLRQSDNNTIYGNTASTRDGCGISLFESNANMVILNALSNNMQGIFLTWSSNNSIVNNSASNNGFGIYSFSSYDNAIVNNSAIWNSRGIFLRLSYGNIVLNNNISGNVNLVMDGTGIEMLGSDRNFIISNNISDNEYGMVLQSANGNKIAANMVFSNSMTGFSVDTSSSGNTIFHNSFIDNPMQAYDNNPSNQWDDGYPSGGNFWSEYSGVDQMSGPNQDQPGSDGLGDTPYTIDFDSQDRYPLMDPSLPGFMRPPVLSYSILSGPDLSNVAVAWALSPDDGSGVRSVTGYEIYRSMTFNADGNGYLLLASLPNGTNQFVDSSVGEGDPNNYFYRVCAIGLNNTSKCASNQAGKFTRSLSEGVNLVSIPLLQSDESVGTVLQTLQWDNTWSYDPINQEWKSFSKSKPYGQSLEYLNHTMGIWVNVTQDSNLTVAGVVPTSTTIDLHAGWNLVGFPSFDDNYTVADLKVAVAAERIEGLDESAPPYFLRVMTDADFLQAGFGYWIHMGVDGVWTLMASE